MEDQSEADDLADPDAEDTYDEDFEDYEDDDFESEGEQSDEEDKHEVPSRAVTPPQPCAPPPTYAQVAAGKRVVESLLKAKSQTLSPAQTITANARAKRWFLIRARLTQVIMAPILDMPPRTLGELHASGQGAAARLSVKAVQTWGEGEIRAVELQTEEIDTNESASQCNSQDLVAEQMKSVRGGQNGRLAGLLEKALQGRLSKSGLVDRVLNLLKHPRVQKYRTVQEIVSFVGSVLKKTEHRDEGDEEQQLADLLEDAIRTSEGRTEQAHPTNGLDAEGTTTHFHEELLRGRPVLHVSFSSSSDPEPLLLCCYGPSSEASIAGRLGCLCVWETSKASRVREVLVCEGEPASCCWARGRNSLGEESGRGSSLVVVGTDSGSLALWDLSESASEHEGVTLSQGEVLALRRPSYMTDWRPEVNHGARVSALSAHSSGGKAGLGLGLENETSAIAEVLSLDASGVLNVWSAVPVSRLDAAVMETDFGLRLGSRVRLLRVASVNCLSLGRKLGFQETAVGLATISGDPTQLLVATEDGQIVRSSRFGLPAGSLPRPHRFAADVGGCSPSSVLTSASTEATCLAAHPASGDHFLVSSRDGSVALYCLQRKSPIKTWTGFANGREVWGLRWCPARPAAFLALDSCRIVHFFDLLRDASRPVGVFNLSTEGGQQLGSRKSREEEGVFDVALVEGTVRIAFAEGSHVKQRSVDPAWTAVVPDEFSRFKAAAAGRFAG